MKIRIFIDDYKGTTASRTVDLEAGLSMQAFCQMYEKDKKVKILSIEEIKESK